MKHIFKKVLCLVAMATFVYSCSEPEGGFKVPTPADVVFYSAHVVVGEVTSIIKPDPMFAGMQDDTIYGAMVTVHCTYKGSTLPGRIQIGGAGYIPGLCVAKPLEKGKTYVLFLQEKDSLKDAYEQSEPAVLKSTKLGDYLKVCGLNMQHPVDNGMMLKQHKCPPATKLETCERSEEETSGTKPNSGVIPPKLIDATTSMNEVMTSTDGAGGTASMVTASFLSTILFSIVSLLML